MPLPLHYGTATEMCSIIFSLLPKIFLDMSHPGKTIRVWDKSTNPDLLGGKEVSVHGVMVKLAGERIYLQWKTQNILVQLILMGKISRRNLQPAKATFDRNRIKHEISDICHYGMESRCFTAVNMFNSSLRQSCSVCN